VTGGDTATEPSPAPTKTNYTFAGWYTSTDGGETLQNKFNFSTPITADTTLYARWIEGDVYVVTISSSNDEYGTVDESEIIADDEDTITIDNVNTPEELTLAGTTVTATPTADAGNNPGDDLYRFVGWDTSDCGETMTKSCEIVANFVHTTVGDSTVTFDANR
jgi:uncharacterized repeat protein (TIGR02543 family)